MDVENFIYNNLFKLCIYLFNDPTKAKERVSSIFFH